MAVPKKRATKRASRRKFNTNLPFLDRKNFGEGTTIKFTQAKKVKFLQSLATSGLRVTASIYSGVTLATVDKHIESDHIFKEQYGEAMAYFNEQVIEGEIKRRAVDGVVEDIYSNYKGQGNVVGKKRVFSDKLLEMLAKANIAKFAEKTPPSIGLSTTGVLVVNASDPDPKSWAEKFGGEQEKK